MSWSFGKSQKRKSKSSAKYGRRALAIDGLERRELFAADIVLNGSALVVDASDEPGGVQVTLTQNDNGTPDYKYDDKIVASVKYANGTVQSSAISLYKHDSNGNPTHIRQVQYLYVYGSEKADVIRNNTDLEAGLFGLGGNDTIHGGNNADTIYGGAGSDIVYGNQGNDQLYAHGGSSYDPNAIDHVFGGEGSDSLVGNFAGVNYLHGGRGIDRIRGGSGAAVNFLYGDENNDWLFGGDGSATNHLFGGAGNDTMVGGNGLFGGPKAVNHMIDDEGADTFFGGNRAMNFFFAGDGSSYPHQKDTIVRGEFSSYDYIQADANDTIWNPLFGSYPNKPTW